MSEEIMREAIKSLEKDDNYLCLGDQVLIKKDSIVTFILYFFIGSLEGQNITDREKIIDKSLKELKKDILKGMQIIDIHLKNKQKLN